MKTREPEPRRRTKKRQFDDIVLSDEGDCATSNECFPPTAQKLAKSAWLEWRQLYTSDKNRVFFKRGTTYVDAITGTLYRDGRCITSDTLELGEVTRNQAGAAAILMAIKGDAR
jgi:hypothetical protein